MRRFGAMSDKRRSTALFVIPFVIVIWLLFLPVPRIVFKPYDSARLTLFALRISDADRVVGTMAHSSVSVTVTGEDAQKVVKQVTWASSARPPFGTDWACSYYVTATFFKGTNALTDIQMCGSLFLLHHSAPPYRYDSGALKDLVYTPLMDAFRQAEMKKWEGQ